MRPTATPSAGFPNASPRVEETLAPSTVAALWIGGERELCESVAGSLRRDGVDVRNLAGETTLREFIDLAAACRLFLTNDSGAMHVASALGVPTVAVFGATDDTTTGPTGPLARVVREHAECSPCLLRECPIDHRCMTAVTRGADCRRRAGTMEGDRLRVDTRTKIVTAADLEKLDLPRPILVATGRFDVLRTDAARALSAARERTGAQSLLVALQPLADELAAARRTHRIGGRASHGRLRVRRRKRGLAGVGRIPETY